MLKFLRFRGLLCLLFLINLLSLRAQEDNCLRFEDLEAGAVYGRDSGHQPGDLAFKLKGVDVYLEEFLYSNSNEIGFWNVTVINDIFGPQSALDGQSLFISNINLRFDFTQLEQAVNGLCFQIVDGGGEENIAVNGRPITILPDFSDLPAEIAPGVFIEVTPLPGTDPNFPFNAQVCLRGPIEELLIGGQEFAFDNLCLYQEPCHLSDLKAEIVNCSFINADVNVYTVAVDFALPATTNNSFDLFINNTFRGFFSTADLPLRLPEIRVLNDQETFDVRVCLNDRPDCCISVDLPNQGCPQDCTVESVEVGSIECSFDGYYYARIKTTGTNLSGSLTITNEAGASWSGPADGSEAVKLPIPSQQYDRWTVCDPQYPDCCYTIELDVPCSICRIGTLQTKVTECTDDGLFFIALDFEHFTPTGQFFLFVNDEAPTGHAYSSLPLQLGPFPGNGELGYKIRVLDASELCEQEVFVEPVGCAHYNCEIGALKISERECLDSGEFYFSLDFDHARTSEKFQLILNDQVYESYAYQELPVRVGPLPGDGITDWHVLVEDAIGPCAADTKFEALDCQAACEIGELVISEPACTDASGEFFFKLDFDHKTNSDAFNLILNGKLYEQFLYQELPVTIGPLPADGTTDWHILVEDLGGLCIQEAKLEAVNCNPKTCAIGELKLSEAICTEDGQFYFEMNFAHEHTSEAFRLYLNGDLYKSYAYDKLPVKVGPLNLKDNPDWHVLVRDVESNSNDHCASDAHLIVDCAPKACEIGPLKVSEPICMDNGQFYFELNFEHAHTSDKFQLLLNQEVYESYSYADLPIKVGPLPANTDFDWHLLVRDLSTSNTNFCGSEGKLTSPVCPPAGCKIGELQLNETYCTDDGQEFYTQLNFKHENTSDKFILYLNDEVYGTYAYADLPIKLGPFNALIDIDWKLLVKDAETACAEDLHFSAPNCPGGGDCNLSGLIVERHPCVGGQFLVDLAFEVKDPGAKGYYVFTNGKINGPFSYEHPYITLGPFAGDGSTVNDFLVIDIEDPSCYGYYELGPVDCGPPCTISDVFAEAHACGPDGGFLVDVSFKYDKVGSGGFYIQANDEKFGPFDYGKNFYTIGPLPGDGTTLYQIVVVDTEHPECLGATELSSIDCLPCRIGELDYQVQCREGSQQFVLTMDFPYENPDSERFTLAMGDQVIGSFLYTDLPLSRELDLPENGQLIVSVWDSENADCAQKAEFAIPCCYLSDPVVEAKPCENDGQLWLDLDLKYYNVSEAFQLVYGVWGGELRSEIYAYSDLPIQIGPLPGELADKWYFEVTDLGFFCQSSTTYTSEYCDNDACAGWDQSQPGAYGPVTGYQPGDLIDQEDGLHLSFAPENQPSCNCSVFITKATTFPDFQAGIGQVLLLDNSGAQFSAPGYEIQQLSVDYYYSGNEVLLKVNDHIVVAATHPLDLPAAIAPGVQLEVKANSDDGRNGRMIFTGKISQLSFLSRGQWVLDNFCSEKKEKEDKVWPGDTNLDNIANHIDLLNIGIAYNQQGPPRTNASLNWEAQPAENWSGLFFDNDLNVKHADANGDGRVDRADRGPILENFGLTHGPLPVFEEIPVTDNDPPLYVDFEATTAPIPVGGTFQVPIIFGTEVLPVEDIYGIAFTIKFDPEVIEPSSVEVVYPQSWLGSTDEDLVTLDRTLADEGKILVALTRTNQTNVGGHGAIASLIGAIDDIAGKYTSVEILEVVAITANEDRIPVNGVATEVEFSDQLKPDIGYIDLNASLNIFPNPTSGEVLITTRFNYPIEKVRILDGYGNPTGLEVEGKNRIDLRSLPSGIYMLRIQLGKYTISRKIVKVN